MKTACLVAWLVVVLSIGAFAQGAKRTFEVATVRASEPGSQRSQRLMAIRINRQIGTARPDLTEPTGVSTFAAVERLGLKLEERRAPFDILVVDKIDRQPTEP